MIAIGQWIGKDDRGMIQFNPHSIEDHTKLMNKLSRGKLTMQDPPYLVLRFDQRAIALIEDRCCRITVHFPYHVDEGRKDELFVEGQRIQPMTPEEDTLIGIMNNYSSHLLPHDAGNMDMAVESSGAKYWCYVSLDTVVAYDTTEQCPDRGLPKSWERQRAPLHVRLKQSLKGLLRSYRQ